MCENRDDRLRFTLPSQSGGGESTMSLLQRTRTVALIIFALAVLVRVLLFATVLDDLRHGSARVYGSTAIGLAMGDGLTYHDREIEEIKSLKDNTSGDFLQFHEPEGRQPLVEFLPGPALLLGALWKIFPVHNFVPYLLLQIVLDSLLISLLFVALAQVSRGLALATSLIMVVNVATIKRTLMMGYDFWPQFAVLAVFIVTLLMIKKQKGIGWCFLAGLLVAIPFWFRNLTLLMPFFFVPVLAYLWRRRRLSWWVIAKRTTAFLVPVLVVLALVSAYRYEATGNSRPTRSTFWHTFFAGVGQFPNPYNVDHTDPGVWEFGRRLNKELENYDMIEQGECPNSLYEETLKEEAKRFVTQHPELFLRNWVYRIGIMISPLLYTYGDLVPARISEVLRPVAFLMLPLWFLGMFALYRRDRATFWISLAINAHFFLVFGGFYVVGRVVLPFMFVSILVYVAGLASIPGLLRRRWPEDLDRAPAGV